MTEVYNFSEAIASKGDHSFFFPFRVIKQPLFQSKILKHHTFYFSCW